MADTLGSIIDKLITCSAKLWNRQARVYEIRKMSWEEFREKCNDESFLKEFYESLNVATNLNLERNTLMREIDLEIQKVTGKEYGFNPNKEY